MHSLKVFNKTLLKWNNGLSELKNFWKEKENKQIMDVYIINIEKNLMYVFLSFSEFIHDRHFFFCTGIFCLTN